MELAGSANLDFLRSVAVVLVLVQHLCRRLHIEHIAWIPTTSLGLFGVLLFFVHTSLVLMQSMDRSNLTGWTLFRNFYIRRVFRIYPLSIATVLTALALHLDSDINGTAGLSFGVLPGRTAILAHLLLVQNLAQVHSIVNVLWSLPLEVEMYVVLPFLFLWIRYKRASWPLLALWFASVMVAVLQPSLPMLGRLSVLRFVPNFLCGVIAFTLPRASRFKGSLWPLFLLGLVVAFTLSPTQATGWVLCLILGVMIPEFGDITTSWIRVASKSVATYSYGIYLSHQFSIWICFGLMAAQPLWLRIAVLVTLLTALPIPLYHCIEKPMIEAGARLAARRNVRIAGNSEPTTVAA